MSRCYLCVRCPGPTVYLGRPCPRHPSRGFGSVGAAIRWWTDWQEVVAA